MKTENLKKVAYDLFGDSIEIFEQTKGGAWYEQEYHPCSNVETEKVYGVKVEGGSYIDFSFKTTKKEDTIIKSFVNQYITKWETKRTVIVDGEFKKRTKAECIESLKNNNRVAKYYFYTTLYGIGFFCFFMSENVFRKTLEVMGTYLKSKGIEYTNELSEAGWVCRFVINQEVEQHNELLENFKFE